MTAPLRIVGRDADTAAGQATEAPHHATPPEAARPVAAPALRYSRFVSMMKVVLPAVAVVLVAAVALWPQLRDMGEDGFALSFADIGREIGRTQRLVNARYYSTDADDQPYTITADVAEETEPGSPLLRLDNPKADITLEDGAWVMLGANNGLYSQADGLLDLTGEVNLFHDAGYEMHTSAATLDVEAGEAHGDRPVRGQGPFGELEAEGFRLTDAGKRIYFTGKARLLLHPSSGKTPQQSRAAAPRTGEDG